MPKPVRKMQKANAAAHAAVLPRIPPELLDQLVKGPMTAEAVQDASTAFKKALIERALGAEMSHHLGYPAGADKPATATNQRNGKSGKTVFTDDGPVRIDVPRDPGHTGIGPSGQIGADGQQPSASCKKLSQALATSLPYSLIRFASWLMLSPRWGILSRE